MDTNIERTRLLSPAVRRVIRAYGLIILIALGFLALALFVHEAPKTVPQGLGLIASRGAFLR